MWKFLLPIILLTSLFAREYIAIIDFEGINVSEGDARALTQRLTSELIKLETYQVLERNEMKRLLEENELRKKMSTRIQKTRIQYILIFLNYRASQETNREAFVGLPRWWNW